MIRFPVFLAALAFTAPAIAFEDLWQDFAVISADETSAAPVFFYAAPDRTVRPNDTLYPANTDIGGAMFGIGDSTQATGVEFMQVTSVFETGNPPDQLYILHGPAGFADHTADALPPKGYSASTIEGIAVLSNGKDYSMDMANRGSQDPFSGVVGRFYRLANAGDYIAVTYSTGLMERTLASLAAPEFCAPCIPWRSMLDHVEKVAGNGATLVGASGYPVGAFRSLREGVAPSASPLPPFVFTMFSLTKGNGPDLHLSMYFPDTASAQAGAKALGTEIQKMLDAVVNPDDPMTGGTAALRIDGPIVTVSATFPHELGGVVGYNRWLHLTFGGAFAALTPAS